MENNEFVIDRKSDNIKPVMGKINLTGFSDHYVEQVIFRIYCCKNCFVEKKCKFCKCNPLDKIKEPISCNASVFPDIMGKFAWIDYKKQHNITIL